ncbi:MAG: hypothetical protein JSW07_18960 [bacterium]|nr:MAG: hypothetical protein JSW07_18960 [bacterium]
MITRGINQKNPPLTRAERIELTISYALKIIVIFTIIGSIIEFNLFLIASSFIILLFSALPAIVERKMRITLPVEVDFVITTFLFTHFILGETANYYRFWWFDISLHISSGIIIGLVGFVIIYFFLYTNRIEANPFMVVVFSVSFALAAGALWEIFEFFMDKTFGFNMQKSGLVDTMTDLIVDFVGACIVGFGAYRYLTKDEGGIIKSFVKRFIQYNIQLQIIRAKKKKSRERFGKTAGSQ